MSVLSENLKYLRSKEKITQQWIAEVLSITRGAYQKYEEAKSEPSTGTLIKLSNYYAVTIDILLQVDLRLTKPEKLLKLDNRILFPFQVTKNDEQPIEIIPKSAQAGYTLGYGDPEFIQSLKTMSLPFLGHGKYRAFPISGDSMQPNVQEGSFIIGEYVEHLNLLKNGKTYVVLTKDDGIVYKRVFKNLKSLELHSDNKFYEPYTIQSNDVIEMWEFKAAINVQDEKTTEVSNEELLNTILALKKTI